MDATDVGQNRQCVMRRASEDCGLPRSRITEIYGERIEG